MEQKSRSALNILRTVAIIIVLIGAAITLCLVMQAGAHNKSVLLLLLFILWDLSPFAALLVANSFYKHHAVVVLVTLYILMLIIAIGAPLFYWHISGLSGPSRTGPFLVVPILSWLLMIIILPLTAAFARRRQKIIFNK
jgi:hypothetical protein